MTDDKPTSRSQTLDRGLMILELIGRASTPLTVAQISRTLGLHRSIVYRLVRTLEDRDFVVREGGDAYRLGLGLLALRQGVASDLGAILTPELRSLADELGYATFVVVQSGSEVVTRVVVEPTDPGPMFTLRVGQRHPVDRGAPGRAVLMHAPYRTGEDPRTTEARDRGWAQSHGEVLDGVSAIAVPLLGHRSPAGLATSWVGAADEQAVAAAMIRTGTRIDDTLRRLQVS